MRTPPFDQRLSGIASIGALPWGSHFGVFYSSKQELLDVLVPFVRTGLEHNELCSWTICDPLTLGEVRKALAEVVPDLSHRVGIGQLQLLSPSGAPDADHEAIERQIDQAVLAGFDGLRLVSPTACGFTDPIGSFARLNAIAAVLYPRAGVSAVALMQVVQNHRFALLCNSGRWEVLEGSETRIVRDALARSEEKLQSLFRNMSEGFAYHRIVLDSEGKPCDYVFLEMNTAFERLTGLIAQDVLGKRVTQVLPGIEKDPTDWIGRYGQVALSGQPTQFESYAAPLDRWYAVSAFSPHKGNFAVAFSDITDRKRAEEQRRAAEERLLVTLRSIGDAVISTDTEGRVVMLNRVAEMLTGFVQSEAAGRPLPEVFNIVNEMTDEPVENPVRKVLESGTIVGLANHTALVRRDGTRVSIADSAAPVRSENGALLGVVLVFRDVTEERRAEQVLRESERRLQEVDQRKNEFLAVLSHELRNPLAPIMNSLYILDHTAPDGEQARRAKQVIARQVGQLSNLVNDLLDVTRISRNKIRLSKERLDLNESTRRTIEDNRSLFEHAGVHLELVATSHAIHVLADRTRVAQIIGNLLQNAAKFTHKGGTTRVILGTEGADAVVRVVDDGVGMSAETLNRLFQAFMQVDQTLDRSQGGLGLGLALVKGLVELHGGSVAAASEGIGKGAEFTVRLPLHIGETLEKVPDLSRPERERRRVLIIEDNHDAADSLREVLELREHMVQVAYNGPDGIAKARSFNPDVVLCDIGLPGMDGFEVARAFRADEALKKTYLVALSGYALPEDLQRAAHAGFEWHLPKPPGIEALDELLAKAPEEASHKRNSMGIFPIPR